MKNEEGIKMSNREKALHLKTCPECGEQFTAKKRESFCSRKCLAADDYRKRRDTNAHTEGLKGVDKGYGKGVATTEAPGASHQGNDQILQPGGNRQYGEICR